MKTKLAAAAAPDRRDRVELIGIAYHWPNIGLIHDFDHLFGHNPLRLMDFERATAAPDTVAGADQRQFSPLMSSYRSMLENLFGVRFIAIGVPIEKIDPSLKPEDFDLVRAPRTPTFTKIRARCRASCWRRSGGKADFDAMIRDGGWPDVDPRRTVLLENAPAGPPEAAGAGTARILHYQNTDIVVEADAPRRRLCRAQRRLASVVAGDASTTSRRIFSKPTCCSAPSSCRRASTSCASRSTRSRAHSPS